MKTTISNTIGFKPREDDAKLIQRLLAHQSQKAMIPVSVSDLIRLSLRAMAKQEGLK